MALYCCMLPKRCTHGIILVESTVNIGNGIYAMLMGTLYCCFLVYGIGGARGNRTTQADIYILLIILSPGWTMQVMKNSMQVTISWVQYTRSTDHIGMNT
ncbi:hypothetical protein RYX36_033378 [Vicia faba]